MVAQISMDGYCAQQRYHSKENMKEAEIKPRPPVKRKRKLLLYLFLVAGLVLFVLIRFLSPPVVVKAPAVGIDGIEFTFDMSVKELHDLGLVLKDANGEVMELADRSVKRRTELMDYYTLALADSDVKTGVTVYLYNPSIKTVTLAGAYIKGFACSFHKYAPAQVPITVFGVDYRGMSTPEAMTAVAAIGGLTLDEDAYRKRPYEAKFTNGRYTYLLHFNDATFASLSSMQITCNESIKQDK